MSYILAELIDHVISMCEELDIIFSMHYDKNNVSFMFIKNDLSVGLDFSMMEIENIADLRLLKKMLTSKVYKLLEKCDEQFEWLNSQKYGYLPLLDGLTWTNYGDLNDDMDYDWNNKKFEFRCNRMIDNTKNE